MDYSREFEKQLLTRLAAKGFVYKGRPVATSGKRDYDGAYMGRLTSDWITTIKSPDAEIRVSLRIIRGRARQLAMNNDYAKKFLASVAANVIGSRGIQMQSRATEPQFKNGQLVDVDDPVANKMINREWAKWSKKGNCDVTGKYSLLDIMNIAIKAVARDGEALIRIVRGWPNKWGFALQILEADHLDEQYDRIGPNGNVVKMGVEQDKWGRPVAYWIRTKHPGDYMYLQGGYTWDRIPADEMIHLFLPERAEQSRGISWFHSAMTRLQMVGGYEEAELVAARTAAAQMGVITSPTGEYEGDDLNRDDQQTKEPVLDAEPGTYNVLPSGYDIKYPSATHPAGNYGAFMKVMLRGISSGLLVSYNSLANDLEGVNYSSIRAGLLEERDFWRMMQRWFVSSCLERAFEEWLLMSLTTGAVPLPPAKFEKFNSPEWHPRGWAWVDPQKDQLGNAMAVMSGTYSRTRICADQGLDFETICKELAAEKDIAAKYGLELDNLVPKGFPKTMPIDDEPSAGTQQGGGNGGKA